MAAIFIVVTALAALSGAALWVAYGLSGLVWLTSGLTEFCQSLLVWCVEYRDALLLAFMWSGALVLAAGFINAVLRGASGYLKSRRAVSRLPLSPQRGNVYIIRDPAGRAAFTHGLIFPRIYISSGLIGSLDSEEVKAVFLHELHHMRRRDPLRFFLLTFLKDAFFYLPVLRHLAWRVRSRLEEAADDAAAVAAGPLVLAGALVKVARHGRTDLAHAASIRGSCEEGTVAGRASRLLGGKTRLRPVSLKAAVLSAVFAVLVSFSLAMPLVAAVPGQMSCSADHCESHMDRLGDSCKAHCESVEHTH